MKCSKQNLPQMKTLKRKLIELKPKPPHLSTGRNNIFSRLTKDKSVPDHLSISNGVVRVNIKDFTLSSHPKGTFNGLTEEDLKDKSLPDHLKEGLDIVIVCFNPTLASAHVGHHCAGTKNHFWTCLSLVGLVPMVVGCCDDAKMLEYGIGFTTVCTRPTKCAGDLTRQEMKAGAAIMLEKIQRYKPKVLVFNGKGIYEAYVGHKNFSMGLQPAPLEGTSTVIFVMPSTSVGCVQLPRVEDKLPFFLALKKLRDYIRGNLEELSKSEVVFSNYTEFRVSQPDPKDVRKAERRRILKAAIRKSRQFMDPSTSKCKLCGCTKDMKKGMLCSFCKHQEHGCCTGLLHVVNSYTVLSQSGEHFIEIHQTNEHR